MSHTPAANPASSEQTARWLARWSPLALLLYALGMWLVPRLQAPGVASALVLSVVSIAALTGLVIVGAAGLAVRPLPRWAEPLLLLFGVAVWSALGQIGRQPPGWVPPLMAAAMVVAVVGFARLLVSWVVRDKNMLPVALVVMALVDIWGVTIGFTQQALQNTPEVVARASAALPAVQAKGLPPHLQLVGVQVGPGDIFFLALILAVVARHGLPLRANVWWMYALFIVGVALAFVTPWAIPGLLFIGLAGLIANRGQWGYSADEKRSLALASLIMAPILIAAALWYTSSRPPAPDPTAAPTVVTEPAPPKTSE